MDQTKKRKHYWVLVVGDDPEDGYCSGPFGTAQGAYQNASEHYINRKPEVYDDLEYSFPEGYMVGYHDSLSSLYIIYSDEKPTYEGFVQPRLRAARKPVQTI